MSITFNTQYLKGYITEEELAPVMQKAKKAAAELAGGTCRDAAMTAWRTLPADTGRAELAHIKDTAARIRKNSTALIVIGIGGSYLGGRAALEFLGSRYRNDFADVKIYFIGTSLCPEALSNVMRICDRQADVSVNVISKSGTTTEPAIAFRFFKDYMEKRYGREEASKRIYVTTDAERGTLRALARREGYEIFTIPSGVGGRYSVLTAVGLLPVAVGGFDVDLIMEGTRDAQERYDRADDNDANKYAAIRNLLYQKGKKIELFTCCDSSLTIFNGWLRQLFGESEGKDGKGIYPDAILFSTDMHSMGQYIQDGERLMFETGIVFNEGRHNLLMDEKEDDSDNLNYLAGRTLFNINRVSIEAALQAHSRGGVPCMLIEGRYPNEYHLGELIYFFEHACAVSGLILGVDPFDQPGVDVYKNSMFTLLGKPGYETSEQSKMSKRPEPSDRGPEKGI